MLRAFFLPEFKRSLSHKLLIVVPALLLSLLAERFVGLSFSETGVQTFIGTPAYVVDSLVWTLMILSGFISSGAAFSRINERHIPFVYSLPISRLEIWTGLTAVHFMTSLLMVPVILALRPSLWTQFKAGPLADGLFYAIPAYLVLFAAGACFVMLFRSIIIATPLGALITALSLVVTVLFSRTIELNWSGFHRVYGIPLSNSSPSPTFFIAACVLLASGYLGLSLRFFTKGELNLPMRRIRNWSAVIVAFVAYPLVLSVAIETGRLGTNDHPLHAGVSADGRYVAVVTPRAQRGLGSDVTMIDTETGIVTAKRSLYGVFDVEWSAEEPVLNVTTLQSPLWRLGYLLPPSDSVMRLSIEGKTISRIRLNFTEVRATATDERGRFLIGGVRGNRAKLLSLTNGSILNELVDAPLTQYLRMERLQSRLYFLLFSARNGLERSWSIEESAREIPYSTRDKSRAEGTFLFDDGWYSERAAGVEFARRFPFDSTVKAGMTPEVAFSYLVPPDSYVAVPNDHCFAILTNRTSGERRLLAFSHQGGWQTLAELNPLLGPKNAKLSPIARYDAQVPREGVVLFSKKNAKNVTLYDARFKRTLELPEMDQPRAGCNRPQTVRSLDGVYVRCSPKAFVYRSTGEVMPVPKKPQILLYMDERGRHIGLNTLNNGDVITRVNPDGAERQLWPVR